MCLKALINFNKKPLICCQLSKPIVVDIVLKSFAKCNIKCAIFVILMCFSLSANAQTFKDFVTNLKNEALQKGFHEKTVNEAFKSAHLLKKVVHKDKHQFQKENTFNDYLMHLVSSERIEEGKLQIASNQALLSTISAQYNVPKEVIVALWGLESSYGKNLGQTPEFSALLTLAYHSSRKTLFKEEVFAALTMLQGNKVPLSKMKGSWAGAMGQCQFMPTAYLNYAVAYQSNGYADIWTKKEDVFASIANFLHQKGWNKTYPLVIPVVIPHHSNLATTTHNTYKTITQWQALGLQFPVGFKPAKLKGQYALKMPAGENQMAYLVNENNFRAIMHWNDSTFYALSVGILANSLRNNNQKRE